MGREAAVAARDRRVALCEERGSALRSSLPPILTPASRDATRHAF